MTDSNHWIELTNANGMRVRLVDIGASIASIQLPMANGEMREVVVGCDRRDDYLDNPAFLGANVGRFANRIEAGQFSIGDQQYQVTINQAPNHLHGGSQFSHNAWQLVSHDRQSAVYQFESKDGDEGYPGNLVAKVHYQLGDNNDLKISYEATVDQPCPVNLTNHSYFNLDAEQATVLQHQMQVAAQHYLPVREGGIPEGQIATVADTSFDFRVAKTIGADLLSDEQQQRVKGIDHSFIIEPQLAATEPAAKVTSADRQVVLSVFTSKPAVHIYTGNFLGGVATRDGDGVDYQGVALETQYLPDAPNQNWPHQSCILQPGETYKHFTCFQFSIED
ncbi:galactose-1-epimerase [Neiella sp. HB171785]|uniref:Aldose 1-epimerase n=1 Tax=Neiella litorisoli TaxID=2771431 RepID=A0A8J6UGX1_9GAMM|nr:galactose-1-epimerase [Neiella litorisoli]MBD1390901.1 galactose-1-epimerase [Neiella litorisoli]